MTAKEEKIEALESLQQDIEEIEGLTEELAYTWKQIESLLESLETIPGFAMKVRGFQSDARSACKDYDWKRLQCSCETFIGEIEEAEKKANSAAFANGSELYSLI